MNTFVHPPVALKQLIDATATTTPTRTLDSTTENRSLVDAKLALPCKICTMVNCNKLRCFVKLPTDDSQDDDEEQRSVTNGTIAGSCAERKVEESGTKVVTEEELVGDDPEEKPTVTTGLIAGSRAEQQGKDTEAKVVSYEAVVVDDAVTKQSITTGMTAGSRAEAQLTPIETKDVSEAVLGGDELNTDRLDALASLLAAANTVTGSTKAVDRKRKHKGEKRP